MDATDTYTGDMVETNASAPSISLSPTTAVRSPAFGIATQRSKMEMPEINLQNAYKTIQFYQQEPQWLANPRTRYAAGTHFAQATRIIDINRQIEIANVRAEAAKARNSIAGRVGQSLLKLAETGEVGAGIAAKWYALGDDGNPLYENPANASKIFEDYKKHTETEKPQSPAGRELSDRMDLEKKFGTDSPQVKKFDELSAQATSPTNLGKLLSERRAAPESEKGYYDQAIGHLGQKMGISIQYDDQGRPIINYGPQKTSIGDPSVATQSMAQRKLLKYEAASELINDLQNKMQKGDVGLSGVLGEYVGDRLLPQLGVDTFRGQRADVRSTMIAARESLLREISDDTRFSNLDREEISKALPSSGVFESLPNAQQRLSTVRNILNARGRTYSEGLGLPRPEWSLTADEIRTLYEKHEATGGKEGLSLDKARSLLERFHNFKP